MDAIPMVDLKSQYLTIQKEIDTVIQQCILDGAYINGKQVNMFEQHLADYTGFKNVIGCGNYIQTGIYLKKIYRHSAWIYTTVF